LMGKRVLPDRACLITFDDGWQDNYTTGFPILKKYRIPALIFVSTDYIDTKKVFWHVRLRRLLKQEVIESFFDESGASRWPSALAELVEAALQVKAEKRGDRINELIQRMKALPMPQIETMISALPILPIMSHLDEEEGMLSWPQIKEMSKDGMRFGSHSKTHSILTYLEEKSIRDEVTGSKKVLEGRLKETIHFIAYPNGNYNTCTIQAVRRAGFVGGFTCIPGVNKNLERPFELKRINMREDSGSGLGGMFSPLFFAVELSGARVHLKEILMRPKPNKFR
jgi:peptidoglycan/xylan/chitin deacetylase (PgdA/CDA1 family)